MADTSEQDALQGNAQLSANLSRVIQDKIEHWLMNYHTCLPGIVVKFDGNTVSVQPAIKRLFLNDVGWINLPLLVDCPVLFPAGGDFVMTFPIQAGDEALIFFSERSINGWFQNGGIQQAPHFKTHDLSDAFVFVGIRSSQRQFVDVQIDAVELRNSDRSIRLSLTDTKASLIAGLTSLEATVDGVFTIIAPAGATLNGNPL
jgi:hypothetical protein